MCVNSMLFMHLVVHTFCHVVGQEGGVGLVKVKGLAVRDKDGKLKRVAGPAVLHALPQLSAHRVRLKT